MIISHSLGTDHGMWNAQAAALRSYFKVLRYDTRGHGASDAPPGEYSMERLGRDVLELADALGIQEFAFCGLSLGGMTGQWLGLNAPGRVTRLVLANTSPRFDPTIWETRRRMVLEEGMAGIADTVMQRFFPSGTLTRKDPVVADIRRVLLGTDPTGYAGCCSAIRDMDHTDALKEIRVPVLLIVGDRDPSTPWAGHGDVLAREIPNATVVRLKAGHLSNLDRPRVFTAAISRFLSSTESPVRVLGRKEETNVGKNRP